MQSRFCCRGFCLRDAVKGAFAMQPSVLSVVSGEPAVAGLATCVNNSAAIFVRPRMEIE